MEFIENCFWGCLLTAPKFVNGYSFAERLVFSFMKGNHTEQKLLFGEDSLMKFFWGSAVRRTGIVGIVFAAAIFFTINAKLWIDRDLIRRSHYGKKAL